MFWFSAKAPRNLKEDNLANVAGEMFFIAQKLRIPGLKRRPFLFGYGTKAIRWTATDAENKM